MTPSTGRPAPGNKTPSSIGAADKDATSDVENPSWLSAVTGPLSGNTVAAAAVVPGVLLLNSLAALYGTGSVAGKMVDEGAVPLPPSLTAAVRFLAAGE